MFSDKMTSVLLEKKEGPLYKPIDSINRLFKIIKSDDDEMFTFKQHKAADYSNNTDTQYIYLMMDGHFAISRKNDGLYIATGTAPMLFGCSLMLQNRVPVNYMIIPEMDCHGYKIPFEEAKERITALQLWADMAEVFAYLLQFFVQRDQYLVGVNAYTMIRENLYKINGLAFDERIDINVEKFIHQHTLLSHSGIMKILSELKRGGYIVLKHGRLIKINSLPKNY